jgi:N-acetylglucosaminyldiphosphoundecaprenol N-acetyl-beta-D-mannosaminyltransferase
VKEAQMDQGTAIQNPKSKIQNTATVLGCRIDRVSMDEALRIAEGFVADGGVHQIVTADASMLVMAAEDGDLKGLINSSDLVVPDSTGVVWACKKVGAPTPERVAGVDLMEALCERAAARVWTAYFLGAAPGVAEEAAQKLEAKFPGFKVVGTHNGFLKPGDDEAIEEEIRSLKPQILFVAMGIPKQEKWIRQRMAGLGVPISMGVGGSLDCHSGRVKRAPRVFQRFHIEWLYRLVSNPSKYKKVALLPGFAMRVLRSK